MLPNEPGSVFPNGGLAHNQFLADSDYSVSDEDHEEDLAMPVVVLNSQPKVDKVEEKVDEMAPPPIIIDDKKEDIHESKPAVKNFVIKKRKYVQLKGISHSSDSAATANLILSQMVETPSKDNSQDKHADLGNNGTPKLNNLKVSS